MIIIVLKIEEYIIILIIKLLKLFKINMISQIFMNKQQRLKLIGYFVLAVLIANLVLFAFQLVNWIFFWSVIILGAIFAYKIVPKLK